MSKYTATKTVGDVTLSLSTDDKEYMTWFLTGEDAPSAQLENSSEWYPVDWEAVRKGMLEAARKYEKMNTRR